MAEKPEENLMNGFQRLVTNQAKKVIDKLSKPLNDSDAGRMVDLFIHLSEGAVDYDTINYFRMKDSEIPLSMLQFSAFLDGSLTTLKDDKNEVEVKQVGSMGLIFVFREKLNESYDKLPEWMRPKKEPEGTILGYHDFKESRVYLAPGYEICNHGLFGGLYYHCISSAFVDAVRRLKKHLNHEDSEESIDKHNMDVNTFMDLPADQRTILTYFTFGIMVNADRNYNICERIDDVRFEVHMRKQFLKEEI